MPPVKSSKQLIAESFSRSAAHYDQAANIQQQAGASLIKAMSGHVSSKVGVIADIGCGTGYFSRQLVNAFKPEQFLGVDLAQGMLAVAADHNQDLSNTQWLCDDAEQLSLADGSVDIIFASFSLQWCENLPRLFEGFSRVLTPGGLCCFNTLGPDTLKELRAAWACADAMGHSSRVEHVNHFEHAQVWQQAIESQPFDILQYDASLLVEYFPVAREALQSLKAIGANIVRGEQRQSLTGKQRFADFIAAYEDYRQPEGLPMSYEVNQWIIQKKPSA